MSLLAAVRAAALSDPRVTELLRAPEAWYAFRAPQTDLGPLVVVQHIHGTTLQDQAGLDGAATARLQVDAWATGTGADQAAERLGRAAQRALVERAPGVQAGTTRLQSVELIEGTDRHELDDELGSEDDPPVRFGFDVHVFFEEV